MNFAGYQTALVEAVQTAAADADLDVSWDERESGWRSPSHVKLSVVSIVRLGRDETRREESGADDLQERIYGPRRLTIQLMIETDDADLSSSSWELADRIAAGLRREDVRALLDAAELGVSTIGTARPLSYRDPHGDWRTPVAVELALNTHTAHEGALIGKVRSVEFSGTVEDGPDVGPVTVAES